MGILTYRLSIALYWLYDKREGKKYVPEVGKKSRTSLFLGNISEVNHVFSNIWNGGLKIKYKRVGRGTLAFFSAVSNNPLLSRKTEVNAPSASPTTGSVVAVGAELTLATVGTRAAAALAVAVGVDAHAVGLEIDQGDGQCGLLAALDALDQNVGAVVVELVCGVGGPREGEQALVRVGA